MAILPNAQPKGMPGDRRVGVVWHTQGSGKSLTMVFYAGRLVLEPAMENPTLVVLTDRNDLDDQLFGTFLRCHELLRQKPVQAESRGQLQDCWRSPRAAWSSPRSRSSSRTKKGESIRCSRTGATSSSSPTKPTAASTTLSTGSRNTCADALPNASFIGFTGTPIEKTDANTRAVFGDYISDLRHPARSGGQGTVPIYYESRLAKLELKESEKPKIDPDFEEATEGEEDAQKERLKTKWAALEAVVGADKRTRPDRRRSRQTLGGAAGRHGRQGDDRLHEPAHLRRTLRALRKLRPDWHDDADDKGVMKIVMTGSKSDPLPWQPHIRNKPRREDLAKRFKNPKDPFKVVIVRDMWLTGFDAPCLHTMYVDKPMRGHGLMQAIARVNRVFKNKPGGLVVDYLGLAHELKQALAVYTEGGGHGKAAIDQEEAVVAMLTRYAICKDYFHGFNWSKWTTGTPAQKLSLLPAAQEHILAGSRKEPKPDEYVQRFLQAVTELSKTFALAVPNEKALAIQDDVGFFQAVRAAMTKGGGERKRPKRSGTRRSARSFPEPSRPTKSSISSPLLA